MKIREIIMRSRYIAGTVVRYHTFPTLRKPTVAEHCWRVACIYVELFGLPRAEVLYYTLHHDSGELAAGDVPFMAKARLPALRGAMDLAEAEGLETLGIKLPTLTEDELRRVKISDLLEMRDFGQHEFSMGNRYAQPIVDDTNAEALRIATPEERNLITAWSK